jgi:hypothetical protein
LIAVEASRPAAFNMSNRLPSLGKETVKTMAAVARPGVHHDQARGE